VQEGFDPDLLPIAKRLFHCVARCIACIYFGKCIIYYQAICTLLLQFRSLTLLKSLPLHQNFEVVMRVEDVIFIF